MKASAFVLCRIMSRGFSPIISSLVMGISLRWWSRPPSARGGGGASAIPDGRLRWCPSRDNCHMTGFKLGCQKKMSVRFRTEEHTSELQSLMRISYAVFCLKKKNEKWIIKRETH